MKDMKLVVLKPKKKGECKNGRTYRSAKRESD